MLKIGHEREATGLTAADPSSSNEVLAAENVNLRLLLTQAKVSAQTLLAQAGIDAKEREASDKLQKLILEELYHRIKNTLATSAPLAPKAFVMHLAPNRLSTRSKAGCWPWGELTISYAGAVDQRRLAKHRPGCDRGV